MTEYSRHGDVRAVIVKAEKIFEQVKKEYNKSLNDERISEELLVDVKDIFGNLRSAMDYSMKKIIDHSFPVCNSMADFKGRKLNMPANIETVVSKWQGFSGDSWLSTFNKLNNSHKHLTLIPQKRTVVSEQTSVTHPSGGSIRWSNGVRFGNGISIMGVPINPQTQLPIPNNVLKVEKIKWVDFVFDNSNDPEMPKNMSVLPFIDKSIRNVKNIIREMERG